MKASFLFDNAKYCILDLLSYKIGDSEFVSLATRSAGRGVNTFWFNLASQYDFRPVSFYQSGLISGPIDSKRLAMMQKRASMARSAGFRVVFWFFTDDSPAIAKSSLETKKAYITQAVKSFDKNATEWVLMLEANEYSSQSEADALARHVKTLTKKPLGLHMTPGQYGWSRDFEARSIELSRSISSVDKHYHQYGWICGNTAKISSDTKSIIRSVGKPVVAAEWCKNPDRKCADAAIAAGAVGVGNN
jgi:hypothetical protein